MIKIELIKFEAQDIITSSGGAVDAPETNETPKWNGVHESYCIGEHPKEGTTWNGAHYVCNCGCHDE